MSETFPDASTVPEGLDEPLPDPVPLLNVLRRPGRVDPHVPDAENAADAFQALPATAFQGMSPSEPLNTTWASA